MRYRGIDLPTDLALWRRFLFQACLNSVFPFTLIAWAEQTVDAGLATILNSSAPIFTFLLTWCFAGQQAATGRKLFGVVAGMIGICLIVGVGALSGFRHQLVAELAIVAATVCYAGAAIFGRNFERLDPMLPAAGSMICGAIVLVPLGLVVDQPWTLAPSIAFAAGIDLPVGLFDGARLHDLFPPHSHAGPVGTTSQAYLRVPIGVAHRRRVSRRNARPDHLDRLVCVIAGVAAMDAALGAVPVGLRIRDVLTPVGQRGRVDRSVAEIPRSGGQDAAQQRQHRHRELEARLGPRHSSSKRATSEIRA
jgi:hypothetical protein